MPRHASGHRMDGVEHLHAALLELIRERFDAVLRLRDRHAVPGNEDDLIGVGEHDADVVGAGAADLLRAARSAAAGSEPRGGPNAPKRTFVSGRFIALLIEDGEQACRSRRRARRR